MKFSKILFKNNITDPIYGTAIINSNMKTISMVLENYFPGKNKQDINFILNKETNTMENKFSNIYNKNFYKYC